MAALPSDPPANILEARPWLIALNEAINLANVFSVAQTANTILAGPTSGGTDIPAFRALVLNDLPNTYILGDFQTTAVSTTIGNVLLTRFTGSTGSQTLTLPAANANGGKSRLLFVKNMSSVAVSIARAGSDTIVNNNSVATNTSISIASGAQAELVSDGVSQWYQI